jgi:hypothetical protein
MNWTTDDDAEFERRKRDELYAAHPFRKSREVEEELEELLALRRLIREVERDRDFVRR